MADAETWGLGHGLAYGPHTFTTKAGLEYTAPFAADGAVWKLVLSPPDPEAGVWWGTFGGGGVIHWPAAIEPNPVPILPVIRGLQQAAGFDHIYDFDPVDPNTDKTIGVHSYGEVGPITPVVPGSTISIGGMPLIPAGGPRSPFGSNYDDTLPTAALLSAEITEAWNDPTNLPMSAVATASDLGGTVRFTAVVDGTAGNTIGFLVTDPVNYPPNPNWGSFWFGVNASPADLTVIDNPVDPWLNAPATVHGTAGSYGVTQVSALSTLATAPASVNVARNQNVYWEAILQLPPTAPTVYPLGLVMAGLGGAGVAQTHSILAWVSPGHIQVWSDHGVAVIDAPGLDADYLKDATYVAVWWDVSAAPGRWRLYYRKSGQAETALASPLSSSGIAGNQELRASGRGDSGFQTSPLTIHMLGVHRAELTPQHRSDIYQAMLIGGVLP